MPVTESTDERRVSVLELFFDLVFVFAFTQVTASLAADPTWPGLGRSLLVFTVLWWAWSAYAWLTNAVRTDRLGARLAILIAMVALLLAALEVPDAFGDGALVFALAYLVVRAVHMALYAMATDQAAILRLAPSSLIASLLLVVAAFLPSDLRPLVWVIALAFDLAAPYIVGVGGLSLHASHFAERFGLVVLIALGESIVAIGAAHGSLDGPTRVAGVTAMVLIVSLWWVYFDRHAARTEHALLATTGASRAQLARDAYAYLHFALVGGIVLIAVGIKKVMLDVGDPLKLVPSVTLGGGAALFLLGLVAIRRRCGDRLSAPLLLATAGCLLTIPLALTTPSLVSLVAVTLVFLVTTLIDRRQELGQGMLHPV